MSTECHDGNCPKHNCHSDPESGPFCDEDVCIKNMDRIGFIKEVAFGEQPDPIDCNPVTLMPSIISTMNKAVMLNARFDCPCCNKGIQIQINAEIPDTHVEEPLIVSRTECSDNAWALLTLRAETIKTLQDQIVVLQKKVCEHEGHLPISGGEGKTYCELCQSELN